MLATAAIAAAAETAVDTYSLVSLLALCYVSVECNPPPDSAVVIDKEDVRGETPEQNPLKTQGCFDLVTRAGYNYFGYSSPGCWMNAADDFGTTIEFVVDSCPSPPLRGSTLSSAI